jgi:hypothetical protein
MEGTEENLFSSAIIYLLITFTRESTSYDLFISLIFYNYKLNYNHN